MSERRGYAYPPAAGYGAYPLVRGVISYFSEPKPPAAAATPAPLPRPVQLVRWDGNRELIAWRVWRLCRWYGDRGARLASITARWAWDGPVFSAHRPPGIGPTDYAGIYALRGRPSARTSRSWGTAIHVLGCVALSGRVVEHQYGYRAERAVVRSLRLTVGAHLALVDDAVVRGVVQELEDRYQAPVRPAWRDRAFAKGIVSSNVLTGCFPIRLVSPREGWQLG